MKTALSIVLTVLATTAPIACSGDDDDGDASADVVGDAVGDATTDAADGVTTPTDTAVGDEDAISTLPPDISSSTVHVQALQLRADDDSLFAATQYRARATSGATGGVVLVHEYQQSQAQWEPYIADLVDRGWIVLAIDLRGHGGSADYDGPLDELLTDPAGAPLDVRGALDYLGAGLASRTRLAVIGTSIGANLASVMSHEGAARLAVAISPRDTAVAALAGEDVGDLAFSGLFVIATEDDGEGAQAETAEAFYADTTLPRDKLVLPGSAHGKDLLAQHPEVWDQILTFLDDNL